MRKLSILVAIATITTILSPSAFAEKNDWYQLKKNHWYTSFKLDGRQARMNVIKKKYALSYLVRIKCTNGGLEVHYYGQGEVTGTTLDCSGNVGVSPHINKWSRNTGAMPQQISRHLTDLDLEGFSEPPAFHD